jgi:hypothetical protein
MRGESRVPRGKTSPNDTYSVTNFTWADLMTDTGTTTVRKIISRRGGWKFGFFAHKAHGSVVKLSAS